MTTRQRLGFRTVNVHFGMFDFSLTVIVGPHEGIRKYLRWKFEEDFPLGFDASRSHGMYFSHVGHAPVIWLPRPPRKPREIAALAHELLHAIRLMLTEWAGVPLTRDTDETYCHAMSFAMNRVLEELA